MAGNVLSRGGRVDGEGAHGKVFVGGVAGVQCDGRDAEFIGGDPAGLGHGVVADRVRTGLIEVLLENAVADGLDLEPHQLDQARARPGGRGQIRQPQCGQREEGGAGGLNGGAKLFVGGEGDMVAPVYEFARQGQGGVDVSCSGDADKEKVHGGDPSGVQGTVRDAAGTQGSGSRLTI